MNRRSFMGAMLAAAAAPAIVKAEVLMRLAPQRVETLDLAALIDEDMAAMLRAAYVRRIERAVNPPILHTVFQDYDVIAHGTRIHFVRELPKPLYVPELRA